MKSLPLYLNGSRMIDITCFSGANLLKMNF